jgi:membrane-bound lytic murein transglycosylase A
MTRFAFLVLPLFSCLAGCLQAVVHPSLHRIDALPPLTIDDASDSLQRAVQQSLDTLSRDGMAPSCLRGRGPLSRQESLETLSLFLEVLAGASDAETLRAEIERRFDLYAVTDPVLFTGYYQPFLEGSPVPTERFRYPLYRRPPELPVGRKSPCVMGRLPFGGAPRAYYSREEIEQGGVLRGRGLELVYLDSAVERFVLHVQGAGDIRLPDGRVRHVQYDGSNERPYTSVGRILRDSGSLDPGEINLPRIKAYLHSHPGEAEQIMNENERYIFFRESDRGAEGVRDTLLTPYRSLATDPRVIPTGTVCYYEVPDPEFDVAGDPAGGGKRTGFAVSQDVGAAIRGPHRVDLYVGRGAQAERLAGHLKTRGRLYILMRKPP